jgi:hypothetical protein
MAYDLPPTEFRGKTWIFLVLVIIFGGLGAFSLLLGPLFLSGTLKNARGQPVPDGGIALCIVSVPFLLLFALAVFNLVARRRPILRVCREGVEVHIIGSSALARIPLIPGLIRVLWPAISLQGFKRSIFRAPWDSFPYADVSGLPMARTLTIVGSFRTVCARAASSATVVEQISLPDATFRVLLDRIAATINVCCQDPELRDDLPSWND